MADILSQGLAAHFSPAQLALLGSAHVGIAGAGGLGSNVAMLLARSGILRLTIVDSDVIEPSNLNRQHFWPRQVGQPKVLALAENLRELNPEIRVITFQTVINAQNIAHLLGDAAIWVEALDNPFAKKLVVEAGLLCGAAVAAASGIAGFGGQPMRKRRLGRLSLVGDFVTDIKKAPPLAPRVMQAAALLADCVLEFILGTGGDSPL